MMSPESLKFDRAVDYYDQTRGFPAGVEKPVTEMIARVGAVEASSQVVEIGIGTGRIALPLSHYAAAYYGIDLSRPMMMKLKAKENANAVFPVEGDATRLPYPNEAFDTAVVVHVFHLIPNWKGALNELARVLRPEGRLVHCWSVDDDIFRPIWDVWNSTISFYDTRPGVQWNKNPNFLEDEGWKPVDEVATYRYTVVKTANQFLGLVKKRIWSALWSISDADMARGLAAIEPLLAAQCPDGDAPLEDSSRVCARAYLPPNT